MNRLFEKYCNHLDKRLEKTRLKIKDTNEYLDGLFEDSYHLNVSTHGLGVSKENKKLKRLERREKRLIRMSKLVKYLRESVGITKDLRGTYSEWLEPPHGMHSNNPIIKYFNEVVRPESLRRRKKCKLKF